MLGDKVNLRKTVGISKGQKYQWKTPLLGNMVDSVVAIVSSKKELLESNTRIIIADGKKQKGPGDNNNSTKNN